MMVKAAESLFEDFKNDKELIAFSQLDYEQFYETKWNLSNQSRPNYRSWN